MADTKKPDAATSETDHTEEELVAEAQPLPEEDGETEPAPDDGESDGEEAAQEPEPEFDDAEIEDAEIVEQPTDEILDQGADLDEAVPEAAFADEDDGSAPGMADVDEAPQEEEVAAEDDVAPIETTVDSTALPEGSEATDAGILDDATVDEEELAALEDLDGTGVFEDLEPAAGPAPAEDTEVTGGADSASGAAAAALATATAPEPEPAPRPEVQIEKDPVPTHSVEKETVVVERRGGVLGGFLGGAAAALGLVFAAPYVIPPHMMPFDTTELEARVGGQAQTLDALTAEIETLRGQLAEAAKTADVAALKTEFETSVGGLDTALSELKSSAATADGLAAVETEVANATADRTSMKDQILQLEKRPIAEATDPAAVSALKAYEAEVAALRETVTQQMQKAEELVATTTAAADQAVSKAAAASDAAKAEAAAAEQEAAARALAAKRAQALVDIQAALETGAPFDSLLPALDGVTVPEALGAAAADGIPTLPELQKGYTLAARQALAASRKASEAEGLSGRATTFLQTQLGLRSLAPREGDDPDAVLSRAEAAVADARLSDATAELAALPEAGQQAMADWIAQANARAEALAAADELAASLAEK